MDSEVKTKTEESNWFYLQGMREALEYNYKSGKYSVYEGKTCTALTFRHRSGVWTDPSQYYSYLDFYKMTDAIGRRVKVA